MKNNIIESIKFNEWYWNKRRGTAFRCRVDWGNNAGREICVIEEWCKDNLSDLEYDVQRYLATSNGNPNPNFTVFTYTDAASVAFKLRWL